MFVLCSILNSSLCSASSYSQIEFPIFFFFPPSSIMFFYSNVPMSLRTIADVMNDQT